MNPNLKNVLIGVAIILIGYGVIRGIEHMEQKAKAKRQIADAMSAKTPPQADVENQ